jgi:hypothetical protein
MFARDIIHSHENDSKLTSSISSHRICLYVWEMVSCMHDRPSSIIHSTYLSTVLQSLLDLGGDLGGFFSFLIIYTVCTTPWTGDQAVARPLPTHRTTQTQNESKQTPIPWVGFEPKIPAFERAKTVHALDQATIVIVIHNIQQQIFIFLFPSILHPHFLSPNFPLIGLTAILGTRSPGLQVNLTW